MLRTNFNIGARLCLLLPFLLGGCSSPEVLTASYATTAGSADLSGQWQIRPESLRGQPRIGEAIDRTDGIDSSRIMQEMRTRRMNTQRGAHADGKTEGGLVHVFLKTGEALKITQTSHALFISFDRAVVEEYRFGENRMVSIGAADAQRVSGWDGHSYVIETLGEKGMKLTDRYSLGDDDRRLIREITLRSKDMEEVTVVHEFDRLGD